MGWGGPRIATLMAALRQYVLQLTRGTHSREGLHIGSCLQDCLNKTASLKDLADMLRQPRLQLCRGWPMSLPMQQSELCKDQLFPALPQVQFVLGRSASIYRVNPMQLGHLKGTTPFTNLRSFPESDDLHKSFGDMGSKCENLQQSSRA